MTALSTRPVVLLKERLSNHHPNTHHAFGIDTTIMKKSSLDNRRVEKTKSWDLLFVGWMANYKRLDLFISRFKDMQRRYRSEPARHARAPRALAIGKLDAMEESASIVQRLRRAGIEVRSEVPYDKLAAIIRDAHELYMPSTVNGGGERAVLEARACGIKVSVERDNPKLEELADTTSPLYDHKFYADQLVKAIASVVRQS